MKVLFRTSAAITAVLMVIALAGCGTFDNLWGDGNGLASAEVYGGVGRNLAQELRPTRRRQP